MIKDIDIKKDLRRIRTRISHICLVLNKCKGSEEMTLAYQSMIIANSWMQKLYFTVGDEAYLDAADGDGVDDLISSGYGRVLTWLTSNIGEVYEDITKFSEVLIQFLMEKLPEPTVFNITTQAFLAIGIKVNECLFWLSIDLEKTNKGL